MEDKMNNFQKLTDFFSLSNGVQIPCVGYGTWQTPDGETAVMAVKAAIEKGYRHIDAAACYGNEVSVGKGIRESGINRKDLFVTSKVWNPERGYEKTKLAFEKTMNDLQLDYLDLYLIHWPASSSRFTNWDEINLQTWKAITELYKAGRIRAIGVSNFLPHHMASLMETEVSPMVNQIEFHPGQMQKETVQYCKENNIEVEAWSPLGTGKMLSNPTLIQIAAKYQKSVAQLCIRWCLQNGVLPLPKSITPSRIEENTKVFDFAISEEDMVAINSIPYCGGSGLHPDEVDF
jgi:diketogulonate reductase-like aldo/keto reductase